MKLPEHLAYSFLLAQISVQQQYGPAGTALAVAAGWLPDLDVLSLLGGWSIYRRYHRVLGHGLPVTLAGPALLAGLGSSLLGLGPFWPLWGWLQLALLCHLATDVLFYSWPVQLLWPLSRRGGSAGCSCGMTWSQRLCFTWALCWRCAHHVWHRMPRARRLVASGLTSPGEREECARGGAGEPGSLEIGRGVQAPCGAG
jgi:hypothetical protein